MRKKKVENTRTVQWVSDNGLYLYLGAAPPYMLNADVHTGLSGAAQVVKSPHQDGQTTYGVTLNARTISLTFTVHACGNYGLSAERVLDEHINYITEAFNPKVSGTLIYNNKRGGQRIRARAEAVPEPKEQGKYYAVYEMTLLTDAPYWEETTEQSSKLGELECKWKFPFVFPVIFGNYTQSRMIYNPTSLTIYPKIEVYTNSALIRITNETTEKFILVEHEIADGQKMVIDCAQKTVSLWTENAGGYVYAQDISNWVSLDSDFITLEPGKNQLKTENEKQNDVPAASIFWRNPIAGV